MSIWLFVVAIICAIILLLIKGGAVNITPQSKSDLWVEINIQILNAISTLTTLSNHPLRLYYIYLYYRNYPELKKVISEYRYKFL